MRKSTLAGAFAALVLFAQPFVASAEFSQQGNKLVGANSSMANQGTVVAVSRDGNTALVGGPNDNNEGAGPSGAVWFWTRSSGTWSAQGGKFVPSDPEGIYGAAFGTSVALSADGNTALIGGPQDGGSMSDQPLGAAWIFTRDNMGNWTQLAKLTPSDSTQSAQGVGFGSAVALSDDGNTAVIGGRHEASNAGAAWIFVNNGGTWSQLGNKLVGTGPVGGAQQGLGVAMSGDGKTAVVAGSYDGLPNGSGALWVFTENGGSWSQQGGKLVPNDITDGATLGYRSVALSYDGNTAIAGGPYDNSGQPGAAWVWVRSGTTWSQQGSKLLPNDADPDPNAYAYSGNSVALSADGNTAIIGGPFETGGGATWVFTRTGTSWAQQGSKISGTGATSAAGQGYGVAVSGDGNTFITGALYDGLPDDGAIWVFVQAPSIASVSPNRGPAAGGNTVTLTGSGFTGVNTSNGVVIGGNAVTATVVNPTHITFTAPAHAAGAVDIDVTNSISIATSIGAYTYVATPMVTGVSPSAGPSAGGTDVTITGSNFTGATAVKFGATAAADFVVDSATQITAATPAHSTGIVNVTVTTVGGTSAAEVQFRFSAPPTLTGLNPNSGYVTGGQSVSIAGTNLTGATSVKFGNSNATSFTVNSATQITAVAPARAAGAVNVVVKTPGGATAASAAARFTYRAEPATTSLYKFRGGTTDGAFPSGWLVEDKAGNLYGVTSGGGPDNGGSVFMLAPPVAPSTAWRRTSLHFFGQAGDGNTPSAGLFIDKNGKLYGTTNRGGIVDRGTVFRLTPPVSPSRQWTYQQLYAFKGRAQGISPRSVVVDDDGIVYGTTSDSAADEDRGGLLYKLTPPRPNRQWVKTTLHSFTGPEGFYPFGRLRFDADGALVGTTRNGGANDGGVVYRFTPPVGSAAPQPPKVLFSFKQNRAYAPMSGAVAFGENGEIFGMTTSSPGLGAVYSLDPINAAQTRYRDSVLLQFNGDNGATPNYELIMDRQGALLGSAYGGGTGPDPAGLVFKLVPPTGGQTAWTQRVLRTFRVVDPAGNSPSSDLLIGKGNVIYGINEAGGGACSCGAVFMIKE